MGLIEKALPRTLKLYYRHFCASDLAWGSQFSSSDKCLGSTQTPAKPDGLNLNPSSTFYKLSHLGQVFHLSILCSCYKD